MEESKVPFDPEQSAIFSKASTISNQSIHSLVSLLSKELCEDFYRKSLELLRDLREQHCDGCEKCRPTHPSIIEMSNLYSSLRKGKTEFMNESIQREPELSKSRRIYIDPTRGPVVQESDKLDFMVRYKDTLENATMLVEILGSRNHEMNFNFEKGNFGLSWNQTVSKREHAEEICKEIQNMENLELDCSIESCRRFVEVMEDKVFSNTLEKAIEIKAEKDQIGDDHVKAILSSLSDKKSNRYLELDVSHNKEITNDIIPMLFDRLKSWQNKGFRYLILNLNETSVNLDFIDTLCDRMPVSLNGLWLDVQHLTIDEQRSAKLLNFLKNHHSYMEFFVIKIGSDKEKEEENQRKIQNIHRIKDKLRLFSVIGGASEKLEQKVKQSFLNFGGGKLEIKFKSINVVSKAPSEYNLRVPDDTVEMRKKHSDQAISPPYTNSSEAATNPTTQSEKNNNTYSFQVLNNTVGDQSSANNQSLNSNFGSQQMVIIECDDS